MIALLPPKKLNSIEPKQRFLGKSKLLGFAVNSRMHTFIASCALLVGCGENESNETRISEVRVGGVSYALPAGNFIFTLQATGGEETFQASENVGAVQRSSAASRLTIGRFHSNQSDLEFHVTVNTKSQDDLKNTTSRVVARAPEVVNVTLDLPQLERARGKSVYTSEGTTKFKLDSGEVMILRTHCAFNKRSSEISINYCSTGPMILRGNLVSIRSHSGRTIEEVEENFQNAFNLISNLGL